VKKKSPAGGPREKKKGHCGQREDKKVTGEEHDQREEFYFVLVLTGEGPRRGKTKGGRILESGKR